MNTSASLRHKVTLVFVTMQRNGAVKRLVTSVRRRYPTLPVIAADQNGPTEEMEEFYEARDVRPLWLPFDCGLSFARNRAFEQVETPYVLLADDDFVFSAETDIGRALRVMEADEDLGVLGGSVVDIRPDRAGNDRKEVRRWEKFMLLFEAARTLITIPIDCLPPQTKVVAGSTVYRCDMTSNWGLWRTALFKEGLRWDETIKINGEHEDFFLAVKKRSKWQVAWLPEFQCDHFQPRNQAYGRYRYRLEGRQTLARNWDLTHHLELGVGLRDFRNYLEVSPTPCSQSKIPGATAQPSGGEGHPRELTVLKQRIHALEAAVSKKTADLESARQALEDMHTSHSWKATAPLRSVASLFRKVRSDSADGAATPSRIRPGRDDV